MAKDLIRTRNAVTKFHEMKAQLQSVSTHMQLMTSSASMADAMKGATRAMYRMNRQINLPQMQRIMMQFEKESGMMDMKQEEMDDAINGTMKQDGDDEAEEELINQVLDEIGINVASMLDSVPIPVSAPVQPQPQEELPVDDEIMARLNNLRM